MSEINKINKRKIDFFKKNGFLILRNILKKYEENITIYYNSIVIDSFDNKFYFKNENNEYLIEFDKFSV